MSKMNLKVLFVQRSERYEGQFAPEAFAAVTEFSYDENPNCFAEELAQIAVEEERGYIVGHAVVDIEVAQDEIRQRCLGRYPPIKGTLKK